MESVKEEMSVKMFDDFVGNKLDEKIWFPFYLPQWSSRENSVASYRMKDSVLTLYIADEQKPWCPEWNGNIRVSNLQSGVFSGTLGSDAGQHHFTDGLVVREEQENQIKFAFQFGYLEMRARCRISEENVAALWLIGTEEEKEHSSELCLFELKGSNVKEHSAVIGFGIHPFGDIKLEDCFFEREFEVDVREWNTYALDWQQEKVDFYINGELIQTIFQSPQYPMQFMLNLYDLENIKNEDNQFDIDYIKVRDFTTERRQ